MTKRVLLGIVAVSAVRCVLPDIGPAEEPGVAARLRTEEPCPSAEYPWEGRCEGSKLLYYCTDEGAAIWDCSWNGLSCGPDPSGRPGFVCAAPPEDRCRRAIEGGDGICEGDRLVLCTAGEIAEVDCAAGGLTCESVGWRADCFAPPFQPCGDVGRQGRCHGSLLVWCEPGDVLAGRSCVGRGSSACVEEGDRAACR